MDNNFTLSTHRINIFVGEFGSGKTEFAVNYALTLKNKGFTTSIVDIDLIKPYFRARENRILLENAGVGVVAPEDRFAQADLPIPPAALAATLFDESKHIIMDVGGGDSSIVIGQINQHLMRTGYEAFMVVNTRRPFTTNAKEILETMHSIEAASRLKINGFISNTNLAGETTAQDVLDGLAILRECTHSTDVPIKCVIVPEWLAGRVNTGDLPQFILTPYTHYPWML